MKACRIASLALLTLLSALLLWAGDPWKEKPYTEWTAKEVQRLFEDSPWARPVATSFKRTDIVAVRSGESPETGTPVVRADKVESFVIVQWASSMTVREGIVRARQLQGVYSQEDAARFLSRSPPNYVIVVYGPDVEKLEKYDEDTLRQSAYLKLKETNQKIPAASARSVREGNKLSAVEFHFPRELEGKPVVGPAETRITFRCTVGKTEIKTDFDLRKMVRDGKPDL